MTRVSVFTPSHDPRHLAEAHAALRAQTFTDWEWVVLLNGKAREWRPSEPDERVSVVRAPAGVKGVGALKRLALEHCTGELLVELDHDDLLTSTCLAEVVACFDEHREAAGVFSDFAHIESDGTRNDTRFNESNGWVYDEVEVDGSTYLRCQSLEASPHNVSLVWFAPNHVRAFRRDAYDGVGGYNPELTVLDDQDLLMRLFAWGDLVRIPHCLYLQRMHGRNTQSDPRTNASIQADTVEMYFSGIAVISLVWGQRQGLAALALTTPTSIGGSPFGEAPGVDTVLIDPAAPRLDLPDASVAVIELHDVLQRCPDRAALLNECHRVLVHGGVILTMTPSTDGRGAFQDPSHVSFWNENSFAYLTDLSKRPAISTLTARLQVGRLRTFYPSPELEALVCPYVQCILLALKDGPRQGGQLLV